MAEAATEETTEEVGTGKKSKNTLMIIIIAVLVLIVIGGAITAVLLMGGDDEVQAQQQMAPAPQAQEQRSSSRSRGNSNIMSSKKLSDVGYLFNLDTFTVNLKSDQGRRYLKANVALELSGEELSMELQNKIPVIRDRIIRILSSKTLEEVNTKKGKFKISEQITDTLNAMLVDGSVQGIYFTEFVIQ